MLLRPISEDVEIALREMELRAPDLAARRPGTLANALAGVMVLMKRDAQRAAIREVEKSFVARAEGSDLDRLVADHFQMTRHPASRALGLIRLSRTSVGTLSIPAGTELLDPTGARYLVTSSTSSAAASFELEIVAQVAGRVGNRAANLRWFPLTGASWAEGVTGLVMTNPEPLSGGNEAETDSDLRQRVAERWQSLRRGIPAAIRYAALIPEVRRAVVNEDRIRPHRGGWVDLYVTDGSDQFNTAVGRLVRASVDREARAAGVVVNVWGASIVTIGVTVGLKLRAGTGFDAVGRARDGILSLVNSLTVGEGLSRARIAAAVFGADRRILDVTVLEPAAELVAGRGEMIRTSADRVTIL
jgi:uncharacterized phage protein gp47/JayE